MATEAQIEAGARAIREVSVKRIWASSYPGVKPPIEWDKLKEDHREGYREEVRAALTASSFVRLERDNIASLNSSLIAELAAKDARIAELDENLTIMQGSYCTAVKIAKRAEARVAELEAWGDGLRESLGTTISTMEEERARAERAEEALKAMREALKEIEKGYTNATQIARAALAPTVGGMEE